MFKLNQFFRNNIVTTVINDFYEIQTLKQIQLAIKNKKLKKSIELVSEMKEKGIKPNIEIYNKILSLSSNIRRIRTGKKLLEEHEVELDKNSYLVLLRYYFKSNLEKKMFETLKIMEEKNFNTISAYNEVLSYICKKGEFEQGLELLSDLVSKNIIPNEMTYKILMEEYWRSGLIGKSYEIYNTFPSNDTAIMMIKLFLSSGQVNSAIEFMKFLPIEKITINLYRPIIHFYANENNIVGTMDIIQDLKRTRIQLDSDLITVILRLFLNNAQEEKAFEFFYNEINHSGYLPNLKNLNFFISYFCRHSKIDRVYDIIQEFKMKYKIELSILEYNILIKYYLINNNFEEALKILDKIKIDDLMVNNETNKQFLKFYLKNDDIQKVAELIKNWKNEEGFISEYATTKIQHYLNEKLKEFNFEICFKLLELLNKEDV
eukprot:gene5016-8614_t